jgi:hypothetical protein
MENRMEGFGFSDEEGDRERMSSMLIYSAASQIWAVGVIKFHPASSILIDSGVKRNGSR